MLKELSSRYSELEARYRQIWGWVWEDKRLLGELAHALGGAGLGIMFCPLLKRRAGAVAWTLIALSWLAHCYAFVTARPAVRRVEVPERMAA